jgi:hypothetical protein
MTQATTPVRRAALTVRRLLAILVSRMRRAFGGLMRLVLYDQFGELTRQTERLGSASVESITYLGGELKAMDERLDAIERELAAIRELLERSGPAASASHDADEVASGPTSG